MNSSEKPPSRLYKYSAFTVRALTNLQNHGIYFNSPRNFNDPYDCNITPEIRIPSNAEIEELRSFFLNDLAPGSPSYIQTQKVSKERLREMVMNAARNTAANNVKEFSEKHGVSCFSEDHTDLLMWSHYGENQKGFCLEFDTAYFSKFSKVKYSAAMPIFDPLPVLKGDLEDSDFMSIFSTKSLSWIYEKEWRMLHSEGNKFYHYPPEALTGVYFGPEISEAALEIICLIIQGQNKKTLFWKGTRNSKDFKVDFDQFYYTSIIDINNNLAA
jgi:hypothetical protein